MRLAAGRYYLEIVCSYSTPSNLVLFVDTYILKSQAITKPISWTYYFIITQLYIEKKCFFNWHFLFHLMTPIWVKNQISMGAYFSFTPQAVILLQAMSSKKKIHKNTLLFNCLLPHKRGTSAKYARVRLFLHLVHRVFQCTQFIGVLYSIAKS